jgi:hypothetical protein
MCPGGLATMDAQYGIAWPSLRLGGQPRLLRHMACAASSFRHQATRSARLGVPSARTRAKNVLGGRMPDDRPTSDWTEAERQAQELAALIDAAGDDLARTGPVSPEELRRRLAALEAEWAGEGVEVHKTPRGDADHRPR